MEVASWRRRSFRSGRSPGPGSAGRPERLRRQGDKDAKAGFARKLITEAPRHRRIALRASSSRPSRLCVESLASQTHQGRSPRPKRTKPARRGGSARARMVCRPIRTVIPEGLGGLFRIRNRGVSEPVDTGFIDPQTGGPTTKMRSFRVQGEPRSLKPGSPDRLIWV